MDCIEVGAYIIINGVIQSVGQSFAIFIRTSGALIKRISLFLINSNWTSET